VLIMKKGILSLLVILMVIFAYSTEIIVWHGITDPKGKAVLDKLVKDFEEENPGITVRLQASIGNNDGDDTKLIASVAAQQVPDVYYIDRFVIAQRAYNKVVQPIDVQLEKAGYDVKKIKNEFFDFAIAECEFNGALYGLPFETDTRVMFYNKDLIKAAGGDPEKPPRTVKEVEELANKITKKIGRRVVQIGFIPWAYQGWPYTYGWAFGGEFYDVNTKKFIFAEDENVIKSFEWQKEYAKNHDKNSLDAFISMNAGDLNPFKANRMGMMVDGNWSLRGIQDLGINYGIAPVPGTDPDHISTWAGGHGWVIPKKANHPLEAAKFIYFMSTKGQIEYAVDRGYLPTIKEAVPKLIEKDPSLKPFTDVLPYAKSRPAVPIGSLAWDELTKARDQILDGADVRETLKHAQKVLNDEMEKIEKELSK
jgi:multiple sugar transport system substrate-binding protein